MEIKFNLFSGSGSGKGLKIFDSTKYKEHEQAPVARKFWNIRWNIGVWLICALAFGLSFAVEHVWRYGWGPASAHWVWLYIKNMFLTFGMSVIAEIPYWLSRTIHNPDFACVTPLIPVIVYYFLVPQLPNQ